MPGGSIRAHSDIEGMSQPKQPSVLVEYEIDLLQMNGSEREQAARAQIRARSLAGWRIQTVAPAPQRNRSKRAENLRTSLTARRHAAQIP